MGSEASKAVTRRLYQPGFASRYFVGDGIDIGCGSDCVEAYKEQFPRMNSCVGYDLGQGDAQYCGGNVDDHEQFDFVHSSHCLEHMRDPHIAICNWWKLVKPGGHLILMVPDEDLYEQGSWPSIYSPGEYGHLHSFTIYKKSSWSPASINLFDLLTQLPNARICKIELLDHTYRYDSNLRDCEGSRKADQTFSFGGIGECAIEAVVRKEKV